MTVLPKVRLLDLGQDDQRAVLPEDGAGERLLGDGQLRVGLQALPYRSRHSRTTTKECLMRINKENLSHGERWFQFIRCTEQTTINKSRANKSEQSGVYNISYTLYIYSGPGLIYTPQPHTEEADTWWYY